jgi:hypothetical protein
MTRILAKAFEEALKLPQAMQDQLGQQILERLADEGLEEQATAEAYARQPDSADETHVDSDVWEGKP